MILLAASWIMELVATVHLCLRAGILCPTKGALEARGVAAGGGLVDDPVPPDVLMNIVHNQMLPKPQIWWTKCPDNSTVPVHTHCLSALCCCGTPKVSLCFCSIGVPNPVAGAVPLSFPWLAWASLYTVDSVLEVYLKGWTAAVKMWCPRAYISKDEGCLCFDFGSNRFLEMLQPCFGSAKAFFQVQCMQWPVEILCVRQTVT